MAMTATVVNPLSMPVPPAWDEFVVRERLVPMWRSGMVTAADWCSPHPASMVLVHRESPDAPIALFHAEHPGPRRRRFARPAPVRRHAMALCRLAASTNSAGAAFAAGLPETEKRQAVRVFERALGRGLPIAYLELTADDMPVIAGRGRLRLPLAPRMSLANEWGDIGGYLRSLPAKWRSQLRRIGETVAADAEVTCATETRVDAAEAAWLLEVVRSRHADPARPPLPARYLDRLMAQPDIDALTYRDADGRLLGYSLIHDDGERLLLILWGARRPTDGGRRDLYFDQYLRLVDRMVQTGRKSLVLGKGMTGIKARFGAVPVPLWGVAGWR
jgi:hypothetical protein